MTRPIIYGASYDEEANLTKKVAQQYQKTLAKNDRVPELPLWRGQQEHNNFLKPNLLLAGAPLLTYSLADGLLHTHSELAVIGDAVTQDITQAMKNYFEIPRNRRVQAVHEPKEKSMRATIQTGLQALEIQDDFAFVTADLAFNQVSKHANKEFPANYHAHLELPSEQLLSNGLTKQYLNRNFQFPLQINGELHNCKEPNIYLLRNQEPLMNALNLIYDSRKGATSTTTTITNILTKIHAQTTIADWREATPALLQATKQLATHYATSRELRADITPLQEATYHLLGIQTNIQPTKTSLAEVFDIDSAYDLALADTLLRTNPHTHPHADAIQAFKLDELPRLQQKHPQLREDINSTRINNYLQAHGHPQLLNQDGSVHESYLQEHHLHQTPTTPPALIQAAE